MTKLGGKTYVYHLERKDVEEQRYGFDQYSAHVIIAHCATAARHIASEKAADEGKEIWLDSTKVRLTYLGSASLRQPHIVCSSFMAG